MLSFYQTAISPECIRLTEGLSSDTRRRIATATGACFDKDGLLRGTEQKQYSLVQQILPDLGIPLTEAQQRQLGGLQFQKNRPRLKELMGSDDAVERFIETIIDRWSDVAATESFPMFPWGRAVVEYLHLRGMRLSLVTSSSIWEGHKFLQDNDVRRWFRSIVGRESVGDTETKPHPRPYLNAQRHLRAEGATIAFEDSAPGFRAAVEAKQVVFLIPTLDYSEDLELLSQVYGKEYLKRDDTIVLPDMRAAYFFLQEVFEEQERHIEELNRLTCPPAVAGHPIPLGTGCKLRAWKPLIAASAPDLADLLEGS